MNPMSMRFSNLKRISDKIQQDIIKSHALVSCRSSFPPENRLKNFS